jgi:hypothetical protein
MGCEHKNLLRYTLKVTVQAVVPGEGYEEEGLSNCEFDIDPKNSTEWCMEEFGHVVMCEDCGTIFQTEDYNSRIPSLPMEFIETATGLSI